MPEYLNGLTSDFFTRQNSTPLFKLMELEHALAITRNSQTYLWFANPCQWDDPFEKRFLKANFIDSKGNITNFPLLGKVYAACFGTVRTLEADWLRWQNRENVVRFEIDKEKLLTCLIDFSNTIGCELYLGNVKYIGQKVLLSSNTKGQIFGNINLNDNKSLVRLLYFKRNAYMAEHELRAMFVLRSDSKPLDRYTTDRDKGIMVPISRDVISSVMVSPFAQNETQDALGEIFKNRGLKVVKSHLRDREFVNKTIYY